MPSTSPPDSLIGMDQQLRSPAASGMARTGAHRGSVDRSSLMTSSPDQAAMPQEPTFGPMTTPSMAVR